MSVVLKVASTSALVALVLAAVWTFWPQALGGGMTYLVTHGTSMEPSFHAGDLAIVRATEHYEVGDVVAYRSDSLNTIVMHRIVSGDDAGFVTQGDNNEWLDRDHPSQNEILGRLLLRLPQGGKALDAIRSPGTLALIAAAPLTLFGAVRGSTSRRARGAARGRSARRSAPSTTARAVARQITLASGAAALVALLGTGVLLGLPSTQTGTRTLHVTQQGQFSYTGTAMAGTTYPTGLIETGDTVWTQLSRPLTVSFANTVSGPSLTDLRGLMRLDVSVTAADGWSSVLASGPQATLVDGAATSTVVVDAAAAAALLSRHYAEIGTGGGPATVTVTPVTATLGNVAGHPFSAEAPAPFTFTLDTAALRPSGEPATALAPRTQTEVQVEEVVPRSFRALDLSVPIDTARAVAAGILAIAVIVCAAAAWIARIGRGDPAERFLVRHADRIVPVAGFTSGATVIDVSDAESLHRVAERFDTVVLHHAGADEDVFAVRDVDATYRFVVPGGSDGRRGKPPVPVPAPVPAPAPVPVPAPAPVPEGPRDREPTPPPAEPTSPLPVVPAPARGGLWESRWA
ncbi:MAG: signal peptidase [Blastococcus sp.]|nr:signal peptidase [Blastococcus sp.]